MENKRILVRNRNNGRTGYTIADKGITRIWGQGEQKKIELEELEQLSYDEGGRFILQNLLVIEDKPALQHLNMVVEPEYFYTEADIKKMLAIETPIEAFLDFLDFAPSGALELVKQIAVDEKIADSRKRKAIFDKTGFSIDNAINVNEIMAEEPEGEENPEQPKERRVKNDDTGEKKRRTTPPKYKVVSTNEDKGETE